VANVNSNCWFIILFGSFASLQIFRVSVEISNVSLQKNKNAFLTQNLLTGIDDVTPPRKGFPVNPTGVREERRQQEDGDFDTCVSHYLHSPRRFSTTSEGSSQK